MSKASDLLREQAAHLAVDYRVGEARMYYAVADLMDACTERGAEVHPNMTVSGCLICCMHWYDMDDPRHAANCKLAAIERAITGESDVK